MNRFFLSLICLLLTVTASASHAPQADMNHDQWLRERYSEATSVKEGMTRADLLKLFRMDGGLQSLLPTRYVLKSSNLIKVDVEFDAPTAGSKVLPADLRFEMKNSKERVQFISDDKLKIKTISKPYVEPYAID